MNDVPQKKIQPRVKITATQALNLFIPYVKRRFSEQIRSVALIVLYLLFFQVVVLRVNVAQAGIIATGLALVIVGLTFFIEGLLLGIMPLGETIGVKLPQKARVHIILIFSFVLGVGATIAEPTIGILRAAGRFIEPWDAPLLFLMLNRYSSYLVMAVGAGVGFAVLCGMLRFLNNWSLKPFIAASVLPILAFSLWAVFDPNMKTITGIAWDCGGITTGPVTVPLVLALGIGVCRVVGSASSGMAGLGVVTLASLYPVLAVLLLGWSLAGMAPNPMSQVGFARPVNRVKTSALFESEERMIGFVLTHGSLEAKKALFDDHSDSLIAYLNRCAADGDWRARVFGPSFTIGDVEAIIQGIVENRPGLIETAHLRERGPPEQGASAVLVSILSNLKLAFRAIVPLNLFLAFVLLIILRERIGRSDEIITGVLFALMGLGLFNVGMDLGLAKLGEQVGSILPSTFQTIEIANESHTIEHFDTTVITTAINDNGLPERFFFSRHGEHFIQIPFIAERYDASAKTYRYIPRRGPLDGKEGSLVGFCILFLFAFVMGYGATLAEPALTALGFKVEEHTVGVFKKSMLRHSAALGVGIGMMLGLVKILWDVPLVYLLIPPYIVAVVVTLFVNEEFVNIAWDCGGVTTGPVTVPLVLAMGLGIGTELAVAEGFGVIALASIGPVLTVLIAGMLKTHERKSALGKLAAEQAGGARS